MADTMQASTTQGLLEPLEVPIDRLFTDFWKRLESRPSLPAENPRTANPPLGSPHPTQCSPSLNSRKAYTVPHELRRRR
ncbi:Hypothetical predicted protein, partial [Pelobates cultripes]